LAGSRRPLHEKNLNNDLDFARRPAGAGIVRLERAALDPNFDSIRSCEVR
jgi:hypothetical protein